MISIKGTVKWFNSKKRYGFILGEDEKDIFVHQSEIPQGTYLNEGDKVEFEIGNSDKGLIAKDVKKIEE